jgi:hypothetical protein
MSDAEIGVVGVGVVTNVGRGLLEDVDSGTMSRSRFVVASAFWGQVQHPLTAV